MSFGLAFPPASQQNSSPTPAPDPKPTMIDDWAVSVKPSADPTIIKKHIEKMVEVSCFFFFAANTSCFLSADDAGHIAGVGGCQGDFTCCSLHQNMHHCNSTGVWKEVLQSLLVNCWSKNQTIFLCPHWILFWLMASCVSNVLRLWSAMFLTEKKNKTKRNSLWQGGPDDNRQLVIKPVMFLWTQQLANLSNFEENFGTLSTSSEGREATGISHCILSAGCLGDSDNCKFAEAALESVSLLHSRELGGRTFSIAVS